MVKFRSSLSMNAKYDFYVQWYKIIANGVCLGFFFGGGGGGGKMANFRIEVTVLNPSLIPKGFISRARIPDITHLYLYLSFMVRNLWPRLKSL